MPQLFHKALPIHAPFHKDDVRSAGILATLDGCRLFRDETRYPCGNGRPVLPVLPIPPVLPVLPR
jgi:hypothetical protein